MTLSETKHGAGVTIANNGSSADSVGNKCRNGLHFFLLAEKVRVPHDLCTVVIMEQEY
jgi:hypothetical protein